MQKRSKEERESPEYKASMSREAEQAIVEVLLFKVNKALQKYKVQTVIMGGGVTANAVLRREAEKVLSAKVLFPPLSLSTDNAEMIGIAATVEKERLNQEDVFPNANLKIYDE